MVATGFLGGLASYAAGLFWTAIRDRGHAEATRIEVRRLLGVADIETGCSRGP